MILPRSGTESRGALSHGYLAHNRALNSALRLIDTGLRWMSREPRAAPAHPPTKLLIAVGGHLGDAVIATAILPRIREALPQAEIGVVLGSWAKAAVEGHPMVDHVHEFDHWRVNRTRRGLARRAAAHVATRARTLRQIEEIGYDLALDLNPYFPNSIPLLWRAGIPSRVGYTSGGFGPLLTHPVTWEDTPRHRAAYHLDLLLHAGLPSTGGLEKYALHRKRVALPALLPAQSGYLVLHVGAGLPVKEWPHDRWRKLVRELLDRGHRLVFTGTGPEEVERARKLAEAESGCVNLCGETDWHGFVETVANASAVICVDSAAGHVAASLGTPVVVLMSGMNRREHWVPLGQAVAVVTRDVPCAPCYLSRGCPQMECVREITVEDVLRGLDQLLSPAAAHAVDESLRARDLDGARLATPNGLDRIN